MKYFAVYTMHHMNGNKAVYSKSHMAFVQDENAISVEIKTTNPYTGFYSLPEYITR